MNVGLFFGSFNPIHIGHLIIANTILQTADLQEVWFVVSPQNPFKPSSTLLHEFDRYEMVRLAAYDHYQFKVSDIEFNLPRPSYTIDTLTFIQEKHPKHRFLLLIGEDNLNQFPRWKNYQQILEYFSLLIYPRPHALPSELIKHPKVQMINAPLMDISATFIRSLLKTGKSVKYLVTPEVEAYIMDKKLFV